MDYRDCSRGYGIYSRSFENEGWARVFMKSTGADTEREVRLRLKKSTGQWFLNEEYLLPDIRVPKSADPWA